MSPTAPRGGPQLIPRPPGVASGADPGWVGRLDAAAALDIAAVRSRLVPFTVARSVSLARPELRRSAVAVVLSPSEAGLGSAGRDGGGLDVVLTRRAWTMRTHRGEVSFPGGTEDPGDDFPVGTALREACEEVGLDPDAAEMAGALDPLTTFTSDRVVVPVVFLAGSPPTLVRSPHEVDGILRVPLHELVDPACYHQEVWTWGEAAGVPSARNHPMHFFDLVGDTVWGATASMLDQLLSLLLTPSPRIPGRDR